VIKATIIKPIPEAENLPRVWINVFLAIEEERDISIFIVAF